MRKVVIIGAGGHGLETADLLRQGKGVFEIIGFLDDLPERYGNEIEGVRVLGGTSWLDSADRNEISVVCGVGHPEARRKVVERSLASGFRVEGFVSPLAYVSQTARLGTGVMIWPFASIGPSVQIGDHAVVYYSAVVAHESTVGAYSILCPGSEVAGRVTIGNECWVGINSAIIQGTNIGNGSTIGAGAAVIRDVPAGSIAVGVPARITKENKKG